MVQERRGGLVHLRVRSWVGDPAHDIAFDEPTYDAYLSTNREADTRVLRFGYESLTTPVSTYDYDMVTRARTLLKREEVLGNFDPSRYRAARLTATAPDGESIPISLVSRVGTACDGTNPLLLYGYGAYGISMDATFSSARLSLLDRGFVFAIAHVRGGQELGRRWYDDGRLGNKPNTFSDFIACADHLVAERFTSPDRLFAVGGSAGGMLVGAVLNMRPDLFAGAVAVVPFIDVVTTMLDDSIPLDDRRIRRVGQPARTRRPSTTSSPTRPTTTWRRRTTQRCSSGRAPRLAGPVLGAGEVGRQAAGVEDRREPTAAQDQHGCRTRRRLGALSPIPRNGVAVRLPAVTDWAGVGH